MKNRFLEMDAILKRDRFTNRISKAQTSPLQDITHAGPYRIAYDRLTRLGVIEPLPNRNTRKFKGTAALQAALNNWTPYLDKVLKAPAYILTGGVTVQKPGEHGIGNAIDIDGFWWSDTEIFLANNAPSDWFKYLTIEATLRKAFGTVLNYDYNVGHHDHWHCDLGHNTTWRKAKSQSLFAQRALNVIWRENLTVDGDWGANSIAAMTRAGYDFDASGGWDRFLDDIINQNSSAPFSHSNNYSRMKSHSADCNCKNGNNNYRLSDQSSVLHVPDNRTAVNNSLIAPYRWICKIEPTFKHPDTGTEIPFEPGSGLLVGPRHILTAAHVIENIIQTRGATQSSQWQKAVKVKITPGSNGAGHTPFGTYEANVFRIPVEWSRQRSITNNSNDYALIILNENIGTKRFDTIGNQPLGYWSDPNNGEGTAFTTVVPQMLQGVFALSGYPHDNPSVQLSKQWQASGNVEPKIFNGNILLHKIDSGIGQSGGPIWKQHEDGKKYLYAVHTGNNTPTHNMGVLMVSAVINQVIKWRNDDLSASGGSTAQSFYPVGTAFDSTSAMVCPPAKSSYDDEILHYLQVVCKYVNLPDSVSTKRAKVALRTRWLYVLIDNFIKEIPDFIPQGCCEPALLALHDYINTTFTCGNNQQDTQIPDFSKKKQEMLDAVKNAAKKAKSDFQNC